MPDLTEQEQQDEWLVCAESPAYFVHHFCKIYDSVSRVWVPFLLWPAQIRTLRDIHAQQLTVILKARQIGFTWLCLAYELWSMIFQPIAIGLNFSKRDDEAVHLLSKERMRGVYNNLPPWLQARAVVSDNDHEFALSNGSVARAFPSTAGDSYTATFAFVDEADLHPNLKKLMGAVKPTIDAGGKMVLLSRSDKSKPESEFKKIYRAAKAHTNNWFPVFLPWHVRPGRTQEWYEAECQNALANDGALDTVHEQYPATDVQALAPNSLDKRLAPQFLQRCYRETLPVETPDEAPTITGLILYAPPVPGRRYMLGADPAEGNPNSDDSSLHVLDDLTGEEVASLAGKFEPTVFAGHINEIGVYFNSASVMVERNNHGHAVIQWLEEHSNLWLCRGADGKPGFQTNATSKTLLYSQAADAFRNQEVTVRSFSTLTQLQSISAATLKAPEGQHDDRAMSFVLTLVARATDTGPLVYGLGDDE